jgi:phosphatidate cytidylyltransferase
VLVSVIAIPIVIGVVLAGDAAMAAVLAMVSAVGAWELYRLARAAGSDPLSDIGIVIAGLIPLAVHAGARDIWHPSEAVIAVVTLIVFAVAIWARGVDRHPLGNVAITLFGAAYTGGMLSFAYAIRYHPYAFADTQLGRITVPSGALLLMLPLLATWASDIGAYAAGRTLGRHKLIPAVSPGKTVEGAIGGLVASALVGWGYTTTVLVPAAHLGFKGHFVGTIAFGLLVSAAAQIGDLAESLLKREADVKDSSRIIPGHGGILDRVDSLFFVLPVSYLLLGWMLTYAP